MSLGSTCLDPYAASISAVQQALQSGALQHFSWLYLAWLSCFLLFLTFKGLFYFCADVLLLVGIFSVYFLHLKYNENSSKSDGSILLLLAAWHLLGRNICREIQSISGFLNVQGFFFSLLLVSAVGGLRR